MLNYFLAGFYERDIKQFIEEIYLFENEENLWKTAGSVKNSSGNLALHIIGGLNYLIGNLLADNGYVRNRAKEFTERNVPRNVLVSGLEKLIPMINDTINGMNEEDLNADFPIMFDDAWNSRAYVLVQLHSHLNYHLGQVNYLRRVLE